MESSPEKSERAGWKRKKSQNSSSQQRTGLGQKRYDTGQKPAMKSLCTSSLSQKKQRKGKDTNGGLGRKGGGAKGEGRPRYGTGKKGRSCEFRSRGHHKRGAEQYRASTSGSKIRTWVQTNAKDLQAEPRERIRGPKSNNNQSRARRNH